MLPSGRLFLDRDCVHGNLRARQRARWLYDDVSTDVDSAPELGGSADSPPRQKARPFPRGGHNGPGSTEDQRHWGVIAEVAESYPRLLAWLAEGQVSRYWNVFGTWIALLRLIPGARRVVWHFLFKPVAYRAPWRAALYEAILQDRRHAINQAADRLPARLTVRGPGIPGLSAVTDVAVITPTGARDEMRRKIVSMSSGCVGISGLRGSGKTTLISDFCAHRYGTPRIPPPRDDPLPGLRLLVQAPLRFDARDFLIHLYTCLCKAVLTDARLNPRSLVHHVLGPLLMPRTVSLGSLVRALSGIALLIVSGGLAYRAVSGEWPAPSMDSRAWEWAGVAVVLIAAMLAAGWRTRQALIEASQVVNLSADAQARLARLHFQRTDTRSHGGTLGGPMGTGLSLGTSRELVEQAMTLPELIHDYRDFVERVVAALQQQEQADVRLVIGIDAIDQIDDEQAACKFLDELSSVFGTPRCVYLISVSPGTLAAVDQRTVPLKTSSGGLFDEMVWLEPLDLSDAGELLDHRVTGLPAAFLALCYVLSGGLPRELLRVARAIYNTSEAADGLELACAAHRLVGDEIRALKHRAMAGAVSSGIAAGPGLLRLMTDDGWPLDQMSVPVGGARPPASVQTVLADVSQLWAGPSWQRFAGPGQGVADVAAYAAQVCDTFLGGLFFLLTVHQLFTATPERVSGLAWKTDLGIPRTHDDISPWLDNENAVLRDLARARIALSVSPYLASALVCEARKGLCMPAIEPCFLSGNP